MKNLFKIATVVSVGVLLVTGAFAQGKKPAAKPMAAKCMICHMPLAAKMSKANPIAVKARGKTMYCCAGCKMPKAMLAKPKPMAKKK